MKLEWGVYVGFSDFFKRKKVVKETEIETNNSYDKETGIKVGQTLFAKNGEKVIVSAINEKTIIIEYKYKEHERDKSVIGKSLFLSNPQENKDFPQKIGMEISKQQELIRIQKEQEIERLYQEQVERQKKQDELKRREQIELQRKYEEERKRQDQLEFQRRQDEERKDRKSTRLNSSH